MSCLTPYFSFEADFLVGKKLQLPSFADCLKERGTVQMLTTGRDAALEVQVCPCRKTSRTYVCHTLKFFCSF